MSVLVTIYFFHSVITLDPLKKKLFSFIKGLRAYRVETLSTSFIQNHSVNIM